MPVRSAIIPRSFDVRLAANGDRGFGLRTGGPANSRVAAHIRAQHADKLAALIAESEAVDAERAELIRLGREDYARGERRPHAFAWRAKGWDRAFQEAMNARRKDITARQEARRRIV